MRQAIKPEPQQSFAASKNPTVFLAAGFFMRQLQVLNGHIFAHVLSILLKRFD